MYNLLCTSCKATVPSLLPTRCTKCGIRLTTGKLKLDLTEEYSVTLNDVITYTTSVGIDAAMLNCGHFVAKFENDFSAVHYTTYHDALIYGWANQNGYI